MTDVSVMRITGTECPPEIEEEWNKWYDDPHIANLMKFPGVKKAARYKIIGGKNGEYPTYISTYEWESQEALERWDNSPEHTASFKDFVDNWASKGVQAKWMVQYELMRTWEK